MSSPVWFAALPEDSTVAERIRATELILDACGIDRVVAEADRTAVKIHVGEKDNVTHLAPEVVRSVVSRISALGASPFLTETSTLYRGARSNAVDHLIHAFSHGFTYENTGAPFVMADGLSGNTEIEIEIPGILFSKVSVAREVVLADSLVVVSHATGHVGMAFGGCLKNLGMGLSSRMGKLRQHSSVKPYVEAATCTLCRKCIKWCPEEAVVERDGKAAILAEACIGCGECLAVCRFGAVQYNWGVESAQLQRSVAEHALGVVVDRRDKCLFLNYLVDMTQHCDCIGERQEPILPDIGLLASRDPVAVDQATGDLTRERSGGTLAEKAWPGMDGTVQLAHAESIGLGSRSYELVSVGIAGRTGGGAGQAAGRRS